MYQISKSSDTEDAEDIEKDQYKFDFSFSSESSASSVSQLLLALPFLASWPFNCKPAFGASPGFDLI